ncbi:hypothetical protein EON65_31720 [archaeon]|nr:MAG: hypothetical protein EON65_31720 [archaeon]
MDCCLCMSIFCNTLDINTCGKCSLHCCSPITLHVSFCVFVGELGTTVVHFTIRQSVYIPHATTETHVTRGSTLKLVVLPTSDLLTMAIEYGGYKCIGSQQALSQGMISTKAKGMLDWYLGSNLVHTSSATTTSTIGISQVKASLKALSTLSRVVDNLALRSSNPTQKVHIPYRDSVLTRYLRSSLEGNCFLSMLTFPSCSDREQASRALRFAASIGQLHRVIWCKEEVVMSSIISNKSIAFQTGKQDYFDTIESLPNTHTHTSGAGDPLLDTGTGAIANFEVSTPIKQTTHLFIQSSLDFVQAQAAMESEISSLTYGLNEIERLRLACLSSLMNVTQVKQYTYNMNGGFCNAISDVQDEDESGYNHMNEYEDDRYGIKGAINESKASMLPSIGSVGLASPSSLLAVSETKSLDVRSVAKHAQQLRAGSRQSLPPLQSPSSKEKRAPAKILLDNSKSQTMTDDSSANNRQVMKPSRRGSEQLSTMSGTRGNKTVLASPVNPRSPHAHGVISSSSAPSTPSRTSHISGAALSPVKKLVAAVLSGSSGSNTVPRHKSTTRRLGVEKSAQSLLFGSTITSTKKPPATFSFVPVQSRSSRLSFEIKATTNSDASYRVSSLTFEDQNGVVCEELLEPSHYSPSNGDTSALSAHDGRFMALKHDISALADSPPLTNEKAFGDDEVGGADIREGSYHFSTNNATQIAMSSPSPFPYLSTNVDLDKLDCENYSIPAGASQPVSGQEEEHGESDDDWTDEDEGVESLVELLRARLHENAPKKSTSSINDAQDRNSLHHLKRGRITEGGRRMKRHDAMEESDPSPTTKKMTRRIRDVEPSDLMEQSDDDDLSLLERTFLRNVARCNVVEVQVNVREGVNIHVKNTFER